jgi:hypothetical protein
MKELLNGFWVLFCALIVSCLMFTIGTAYSLGYAIWLSVTLKDWKAFFNFWWRLVDGFAAALGYALYEIAYSLDLAWNVNGEILEDIVTAKEETNFSKKNISVSESVGKLEIDENLNSSGKKFSKMLNIFFNQKQHAIDAWRFSEAKKKLMKNYFHKK